MPLTNEKPERVVEPEVTGWVPGGRERSRPVLPSPGPGRRELRPSQRCPAPNPRPGDGETPRGRPRAPRLQGDRLGTLEAGPRGGGATSSSLMVATAWACGSDGRPATHPVFVNRVLGCRGQPASDAEPVAPVLALWFRASLFPPVQTSTAWANLASRHPRKTPARPSPSPNTDKDITFS